MFFHGGGFGPPPPSQESSALYAHLGVTKSASEGEIKKAYRGMALKYHPDKKGGHEEKFKRANEAYQVLSDPERRAAYDAGRGTGENAGSGGGGGGGGPPPGFPHDIFNAFFGGQQQQSHPGHPHQGQPQQQRRPRDAMHDLPLTLEQIFQGQTMQVEVERDAACDGCDGRGGEGHKTCVVCRGAKVQTSMRHIGPGIVQKMVQPCPGCKGTGTIIADSCGSCGGSKVMRKKERARLGVPPGISDGDRIHLHGLGDAVPDDGVGVTPPGDAVFVIRCAPHPTFTRRGDDLHMTRTLSLEEALCGFSSEFTGIDGGRSAVRSEPGRVTKPGDMVELRGMGMPGFDGGSRGKVVITYDVRFPDRVEECKALSEALPAAVSARA